jgi:hypothetical protein
MRTILTILILLTLTLPADARLFRRRVYYRPAVAWSTAIRADDQAACRCSEGQRVNDGRTGHPTATQFERFDLQLMEIHEYAADVGRYEIAKRHEQGGRLKLAKLIEEFGWKPEEPKAITHEQF